MTRLIPLLLLAMLVGCKGKPEHPGAGGKRAFYYWQTYLNNFSWGDSTFQALHANKLYIRFFDVDWNAEAAQPVPVSPLEGYSFYRENMPAQLVPVVYITNETFKNLTVPQAEALAENVHRKVMARYTMLFVAGREYQAFGETWWQQNPYQMKSRNFDEQRRYDSLYTAELGALREVQFDCDWTNTTRDAYFAFLKKSRDLFKDILVSSTVRLYQYKYPDKAGVPPVSRGMLMCYNAGDVTDIQEQNSIFNKSTIESYLDAADYPVPLDYALPLFQWALVYQQGKLRKIVPVEDIEAYAANLKATQDQQQYTVEADFVLGYTASSIYLRRGDLIRIETPNLADVAQIARWLGEHKNTDDAVLTLYHLNQKDLEAHATEIEAIFAAF